VIARAFLATLLLNSATMAAQTTPAPPPLELAERALVQALSLPDRDAFRQLLAPDAVFFLPVDAYGPDAITGKWLPFLLDPALTMVLTIDSSTTATAGKVGLTSGTFAIHGRTNLGVRTTPGGTFSIVWHLVEDRWKIQTLSGAGRGEKRRANR